MEIIVLRTTNYKEKDGIIDAINATDKVSFLCRGLFSSKSKNAFLNNPLTVADVEISEGKNKYPVISSSFLIESPINPHADLRYMAVIMLLSEATNFLLSDEEKPQLFDELKSCLKELKSGINPLTIAISYLAKVLKISGYDFSVNECVMCGSKKGIATFSFNDGGFICSNCYTPDIPKLFNKEQMLAIREAFLTDKSYISPDICSEEELLFVLDKFFEFIYDSYGYKIKSKDLLK